MADHEGAPMVNRCAESRRLERPARPERPGRPQRVEEHRPRRPEEPGRPGGEEPPKDSPNTHTSSPQPAPASPPRRDQRPRGATSSHRPRPTWIHTVAAAASTGWLFQIVTPLFTRCCTHSGERAAAGWITPDGSPRGIDDCA